VAGLFGVRVTGPLQAHAPGFSEQLTELGYTRASSRMVVAASSLTRTSVGWSKPGFIG
jgi:hypothetical protein